MKVVVGLGNPGPRYAATRHNVGFWTVDRLAARHRLRFSARAHRSRLARGVVAGADVVLLEPQTFMNDAGDAVGRARRDLGVDPADFVVACDDLDLPLGRIRVRPGGGAGGHRGVASIIEALGDGGFARVRVGIGRPPPGVDAADWVLDVPADGERAVLERAAERAADALETLLAEGVAAAMSRFNRKTDDGA